MIALAVVHLGDTASADEPHPGLNFWIGVSGMPNCDTKSGDASCDLAPGSTFVVGVYLDSLPRDLPQYAGYEAQLNDTGVTPNQDATSNAWPDCAVPFSSYGTPNRVAFGCAKGVPPAPSSSYTGLIGTNSFVCKQSGTIVLAHGVNKTDVIDDSLQLHAEDPNTSETLTVNCVVGGVEPATPTPGAYRGATGLPPPESTLKPPAAVNATLASQPQPTNATQGKATRVVQTPFPSGRGPGGAGPSSGGGLAGWQIALIVVGGIAAAGSAAAIGIRATRGRSP